MAPIPTHDRHLWDFQWVRDLLVIGGALFALWLGYRLTLVTVPLLVALAMAYCCEPVVRRLARLIPRLGRTGAAAILLAGIGLVLVAVAAVALVPLVTQATAFVREAPAHLARAETYLTHEDRPTFIRERAAILIKQVHDRTEGKTAEPDESGDTAAATGPSEPGLVAKVVGMAVKVLGGATATVVDLGVFLVILVFSFVPLSAGFPAVAEWLRGLMPSRMRRNSEPLLARMDAIISGFVRGRLITAGILALVYATGWSICGVPYAIVLGLITGLLSLVPYLAAIGLPVAWALVAVSAIGASEAGFYVAMDASGVPAPIWWKILVIPAIVNSVAQSLEDYVLTPLIQGNATQLHPVAIMLAIIAGGSLAGLYGMILAVPVAACAKVLLSEVVGPRLRRWAEEAAGPVTAAVPVQDRD